MWHDSDRRLAKAVERFEDGDVQAARAMLRQLDRRGVISPRIDLYLGHCHLETDQLNAALRRYRRSVQLDPSRAAAWMGLGLCHGRLGRLDRAIAAFERAARCQPDLEEAHCNLAHCHALRGDVKSARRHAQQAMRLDPTCPHVHRHMALAYLLADQPERSLRAWWRVRLLSADHPELDVGLGRTLTVLGRREDARAAFHRGLKGPFASDAAFGLGDLASLDGRPADAAAHFRAAVRREPGFTEARVRWADAHRREGRLQDAWLVIQPLLRAEDPDVDAIELGVTVLRERGERVRALKLARRLARPAPDASWLVVARHLTECHRDHASLRVVRRVRRADPANLEALRLEARLLCRVRRPGQAVSLLARAAHQLPRDAELQLDVAAIHLARQCDARAERHLLRALSMDPEQPDLWTAAAELAFDDGRLDLAFARVRSALRRFRRHPAALGLLVRIHYEREDARRAAHAGQAAARVLPAEDVAIREFGRALTALGRRGAAWVQLRRYVAAAPGDPAGYLALGDVLEAVGDPQGADRQRRLAGVVARVV